MHRHRIYRPPHLLRSGHVTLLGALAAALAACSAPRLTPPATEPPHVFIKRTPDRSKDGLRLAVKDVIDMKGEVTTAGSHYFADAAQPAPRDAACLRLARAAGVDIVGKTNTTEFALGVSGINDYFGTPENPVTRKRWRIPGGSSSGSAAAVALDLADVAFGTDTAGSIRVPAACCGVAGLKTTYGLVPLEGVYPIAPEHLDTVGPIARDIDGLARGMALLDDGFEARYGAARAANPNPDSIRIGRLYVPNTDPAIDHAIDRVLRARGFQLVEMSDEFRKAWEQAQDDGTVVAAAGAWVTNREHRTRPRVSGRTKAIMLLGQAAYENDLATALARKPQWRHTLARAFDAVDFIALPTMRSLPPRRPLIPFLIDSAVFEATVLAEQNTVAVNLAGNPALALPVAMPEDAEVPVTSLQLIGPLRSEAELLNVGRLIESN